jgi:hypothetical protein
MANELSLASIGFSIRNQVKGHFSTDDERIDIELIYKMIRDVRSLLIEKQIKQQGFIDPELYQEICCLEIKCRNLECNGIKTGETEYYVELPALETTFGRFAIKYFGTVDKKIPFNRKSFEGYLWGKSSPWTGNKPYYSIVGFEAKIRNLPTTAGKYVCIIAVLEDPLNGKCYRLTENDPYPISQSMVHELELICIKQLMSTLQSLPDERNNAADNPRVDQIPVAPPGK